MSASKLINVTKLNSKAYKKLPKLSLDYGTASTRFGNCLTAFEGHTLCFLTFYDKEPPLEDLKRSWPNAALNLDDALVSANVTKLFEDTNKNDIDIYLKGTDFEIEVWETLLKLKKGTTMSYEGVAKAIGRPKAVRAVARAVAKNNVSYFVPCHRVIKKNGAVHKYGGGADRKVAMLKDEGAI